jgi:hypothetical protein
MATCYQVDKSEVPVPVIAPSLVATVHALDTKMGDEAVDRSRCPAHGIDDADGLWVYPDYVPERGVQLDPDVEPVEFLLDSRNSNIFSLSYDQFPRKWRWERGKSRA